MSSPKPKAANARIAGFAAVGALAMLGLAFASKPLYDTFCRVTGFGGTTQVAESAASRVLDRTVSVSFDANVNSAPLEFRPSQRAIEVKLGQNALAYYEVTNTSDHPVQAIASYNVTPYKSGLYFNKLECFCFDVQTYMPGETVTLPVIFFVDPRMDDVERLDDIQNITLSYTFFEADSEAFAQATDRRGAASEG